jgi:hypothetical protein
MARFLYVVFTEPAEGREDEYNDWYDNQHLADVVKVPGVVSAERLELRFPEPGEAKLPRYLALYEVETDDVTQISPAMAEARASGRMPVSDALDTSTVRTGFYAPRGERVR